MPTKSHELILTTSKNLFWKYGIRKVTVEEICKEAGVSKMTFYRLFENKDAVARKVLADSNKESLQAYRDVMGSTDSFPEKVKKVIQLQHLNTTGISEEFIQDIYLLNESQLMDHLERYQIESRNEMIKDFVKAQKEGWIRKDVKMEFILHMLETLERKMEDQSFLSLYNSSHDAIMELINFFFYGIFDQKTNN